MPFRALFSAAGEAWSARPWPAFFVRAPDLPVYQKSVPEPRILSDVSGDSEKVGERESLGGMDGRTEEGLDKCSCPRPRRKSLHEHKTRNWL